MEKFLRSFYYAWAGLAYVFRYERNARIHLLFAVLVMVLGLRIGISDAELAAIFFAVILVFLAEIFNTVTEKTLDLIHTKEHPQVKIIKDMAAGGVLVTALAAVSIGIVIFTPYVMNLWAK